MLHFNEASGFIFRLHFALSIMTVLIIESKLFLYISMGLLLLFWFWVYCLLACLLASVTTVVLYSVSMFSYMSVLSQVQVSALAFPVVTVQDAACGEHIHRNTQKCTVGCWTSITLYRQCFLRLGNLSEIQIHFI